MKEKSKDGFDYKKFEEEVFKDIEEGRGGWHSLFRERASRTLEVCKLRPQKKVTYYIRGGLSRAAKKPHP